jgi:hypothetical protein
VAMSICKLYKYRVKNNVITKCKSSGVVCCKCILNYFPESFSANSEFRSVYEQHNEPVKSFRICRKTCLCIVQHA